MLLSVIVNAFVARLLFRCGRETESVALQADGWHLLTDVYTSAGVMAALGAFAVGRRMWPEASLDWIDPVAAILVAGLILKAAWDLTRQSLRDLMDENLPAAERNQIEAMVRSASPCVLGMHGLRGRRSGAARYIEMHVQVAADMPVKDSHALSHAVADHIRLKFPGAHVIVHIEPG